MYCAHYVGTRLCTGPEDFDYVGGITITTTSNDGTDPDNGLFANSANCSHYYSQAEFGDFIDKFDDDNADVYTVMQRLFREGSVMV